MKAVTWMSIGFIIWLVWVNSAIKSATTTYYTPRYDRNSLKITAQNAVRARLKDAQSAEFHNLIVAAGKVVCGEVNAKNGFGTFAGNERFIYSGGVVIMQSDNLFSGFDKSWYNRCR